MRGRVNKSTGVRGISKPKGSPHYHAYFRPLVGDKKVYVGCGLHRTLEKAELALIAGEEYYKNFHELPEFKRVKVNSKPRGTVIYSDAYGQFCLLKGE